MIIRTLEEAKNTIQKTGSLYFIKLDSENLIGRISPMSETYEDDLVLLVKNRILYSTQKEAFDRATKLVNTFYYDEP